MERVKKTTIIKQGNTTITTTVKSAAASMPYVGKVVGKEGNTPIVLLESGVKGLRNGSILAFKCENSSSDILQIGRVVCVTSRIRGGKKLKVAYVSYTGKWFSSFVSGRTEKSVINLGNVFINHCVYLNSTKCNTPESRAILEILGQNKYFFVLPENAQAYWLVNDARQLWEQRKELDANALIALAKGKNV